MRFYDYRCTCGVIKEFYEGTKDDLKPHKCPKCGGKMHRIITTAPSFDFKSSPPNANMKHSERRERWNSPDPKVKI
jgi:putative FmdB family regulatory protein